MLYKEHTKCWKRLYFLCSLLSNHLIRCISNTHHAIYSGFDSWHRRIRYIYSGNLTGKNNVIVHVTRVHGITLVFRSGFRREDVGRDALAHLSTSGSQSRHAMVATAIPVYRQCTFHWRHRRKWPDGECTDMDTDTMYPSAFAEETSSALRLQ